MCPGMERIGVVGKWRWMAIAAASLMVSGVFAAWPVDAGSKPVPCPKLTGTGAESPLTMSAGSEPRPMNPCPGFEWAKTFGTAGVHDKALGLDITSDGGAVILVRTQPAGVTVVKLDGEGAVQWQQTYSVGGAWPGYAGSIQQTSEGGFALAALNFTTGSGVVVYRLDDIGSILWQFRFDGPGEEEVYSLAETQDGGFVIGGRVVFGSNYDSDLLVLRVSPAGGLLWQKTYGRGSFNEIAFSGVRPTPDGGFVAAGFTEPWGTAWVLKLDSLGNMAWQKMFQASSLQIDTIEVTSDGGYVLAGNLGDRWAIVKLSATGSITWQKTYRGPLAVNGFASIAQTTDGGYVSLQQTGTYGTYDFAVLRVDSSGAALWQRSYGGPLSDAPCWPGCIQEAPDGNIVVAGSTNSFGTGGGVDSWTNTDAWVLRVFSDGSISSACAPGFGTTYNTPTVSGAKLKTSTPTFNASPYTATASDPGATATPGALVTVTQCSA